MKGREDLRHRLLSPSEKLDEREIMMEQLAGGDDERAAMEAIGKSERVVEGEDFIARTQAGVDRILEETGRKHLPANFSDLELRRLIDPQSAMRQLAIMAVRDFSDDVLYRKRRETLGKLARASSYLVSGFRGSDQSWLTLQLDRHSESGTRGFNAGPFSAEALVALAQLDAALQKAAAEASSVAPLNSLAGDDAEPEADEPLVAILRERVGPAYRALMHLAPNEKIGTANRVVADASDIDPFSENAPDSGDTPQKPGGPAIRFALAVFNEIGFMKSNGKPYAAGGVREAFHSVNAKSGAD